MMSNPGIVIHQLLGRVFPNCFVGIRSGNEMTTKHYLPVMMPYVVEVYLFRENKVNAMADDVLCLAIPLTVPD